MPQTAPLPRRRRARSLIETLEDRLLLARPIGIDVSHYQGTGINWTSVKNAGYTFAWTKATEGLTYNDDTFTTNIVNAKNAGVLIGAYHFARPDNQVGLSGADQEEDHFWSRIAAYVDNTQTRFVPMLDIETDLTGAGYSKTTLSQWVNRFCQDLVADGAAKGVKLTPLVYTYISYASTWLDSTVAQDWPLWMANYNGQDPQTGAPNSTTPWQSGAWQFWQNSDATSVPGAGSVDADAFKGNVYDLKNYILGSNFRWQLNSRVVTTASLKAWDTSAANGTFVTEPAGETGTIINAVPVFGGSYWRWQIHFDDGHTGWSAEEFMNSATPAAVTSGVPSGTVNALPANFTWTAGANDVSYDVYLDGVKKATGLTTNSWAHGAIADGAHSWYVIANNTELSATSATFSLTLDTVAPAASYGAQTPTNNAATMDFTVTYTDATSGLLGTSFDSSDVTVSGPGGFSANASFVSVNTAGNGSPKTVTYRINAPGGSWTYADNGTYTVTQVASQVRDVAGNFRSAGTIGTFIASLPFAYITGSTLQVYYAPGSSNVVTFTTDGSTNLVATEGSSSLAFAPGSFGDVVVHGSANNETIVVSTNLAVPMTFDGQTGSDTINITSGGSYTFGADAAAMTANLSIIVGAGGAATFGAAQHLAGLFVNGSVVVSGAGTAIVTKSVSYAGSIDLGQGDLIVNYSGGTSPIGSFDGTNYTGVTGAVAAGRNGGSWNGTTGIRTSSGDSLHALAVAEAFDALGISGADTATFAGETVDATCVLVKFTYAGDANLDGKIDVDDYGHIDFNSALGTAGWFNGDFNDDGKVNVDDYGIIDLNVAIQGPPL